MCENAVGYPLVSSEQKATPNIINPLALKRVLCEKSSPKCTLHWMASLAGPNDEMDWAMTNANESLPDLQEFLKSVDAMILGRVTYEGFAPYWTAQTGEFAEWMNITPKIVVSTTLTKVGWGNWDNASLIHDNLIEEVKNLKQLYGKDIIIFGGPTLIQSFTNLGFIDEYLLYIVPVILGAGKPLFENIEQRRDLQLLDTKTYPSGAMALHYEIIRPEHP